MSSPASAPVGSESTSPPPSAATSPPQATSPPSSSAAPPTNTSSSAPPPAEQPPAAAPPLPSEPPVSPPSPPAPPPQSPTPPSPPPPSQTSAPPPAESPPPPSADSPPPPARSSSPPAASPPESNASPLPPASTLRSPPPPASSITSPPPPGTSTLLSPPPPPSLTSSPTTTPSTSSTPTSSSPSPSSSSTISSGAVAGIAVVAVVAVSVFLVVCLCFCNKNKKKRRYYYTGEHQGPPGDDPAHYKDSYYDHHTTPGGWQSPQSTKSTDVFLNMPSPPPPMAFVVSKHDTTSSNGNSGAPPGIGNSNLWLTYNELAAATDGFSKSNLLGEGGFGCVYKGILKNGQVVAVKQLKSGASQGEKEFQAEVEIISRVHHRHLVSLVGYCIMENQRLLVYDYVPNNTLEYHLHKRRGGPSLDWPTRLRIASGAARGLAYLHEDCHPRIIHRDIKSANILLDNHFEAQVSDFGLAKLTSDAYTHVTTRVMGTFGYLAPEYASSGKLTEKSDVFSFGVVLLELLTGRKPVDILQPPGEESLVEWARPILAQIESEEDLNMLADPSLNGVYDRKEMMRMMEAAAACVRHSAPRRPRMGQVMRALEDETSLADLNKGLRPGHSSVYGSSFTSSDFDRGSYSVDMRKFRMALNESTDGGMPSNPYSSSEYRTSREIDQDVRRPPNSTFSSSSEFL